MRSTAATAAASQPTFRAVRVAGAVLALAALTALPAAAAGIHLDLDTGDAEVETDGDDVVIERNDRTARISAAGVLTVGGRRIQADERETRDLQRYNAIVHSVEQTGIDMGLDGVGLAAFALAEAFTAALSGDEGRAERRIESRAEELKESARELCDDLRRLERIQDRLAADMPEFRAFAVIHLDEDDCVVED